MHAVGILVVLLAAVCTSACASSAPRSLSARFVRQGIPAVDLGGPRAASMTSGVVDGLVRAAEAARAPAAVPGSLESSDHALQSALARLALAPTTAHHLNVADAYVRQGVLDRAHDYLTRSLALNGPNADVYDSLARVWRDWGQPAEGLGHAHRAVFLRPRSAAAHNMLGTILYRLGRLTDARHSFAQALALDGMAWYAAANLCHIEMASGDTLAAIDQCGKAATLRKAARKVLPR